MGQGDKLYKKIKNNPRNVTYEEIKKLLVNYGGFELRNGKGDHFIYSHPDLTGIDDYVNIPLNRPVKKPYILKALRLYEKVMFD